MRVFGSEIADLYYSGDACDGERVAEHSVDLKKRGQTAKAERQWEFGHTFVEIMSS